MANVEYTRLNGADPRSAREFVQFTEDAIQNPAASERAGRPIYDSVEMVSLSFPGNNLTEIVHRVTDEDRERWPQQYEAFKKHGGTIVSGTPLHAWPALNKAQVREFEAMKIFTVEQLAGLDDHAKQRIGMGGHMWVNRAQALIDAAEDNAFVDQMSTLNQRQKEQIEVQASQIAQLGALCSELQAQMQELQNGRASTGVPFVALGAQAVQQLPMTPQQTGGSLAADDGYVEPKRRGPGRPPKAA